MSNVVSVLKLLIAAAFALLTLLMLITESTLFVVTWDDREGAREWWLLLWWPFATMFICTLANLALLLQVGRSAFWRCVLIAAITYACLLFLDVVDAPTVVMAIIIIVNAAAWVRTWLTVYQQAVDGEQA